MIKLYKTKIFPYLMNKSIGKAEIMEYRRNMLENAEGNILEIGIGTGLNLNLYPSTVTEISAIDPFVSELPQANVAVKLYSDAAEQMNFDDNTFDTVVSTFTLCSIQNLDAVLAEICRVLKPKGKFIFLEHGRAITKFICGVQKVANPFFNVFACGCNINRDYEAAIQKSGLKFIRYQVQRAPIFPKVLIGYLYEGVAIIENDKINL